MRIPESSPSGLRPVDWPGIPEGEARSAPALVAEPVPPYAGRRADLDALRSRIRALRAGRGDVLVVRGPTGAGRSRLLAEARRMASAEGVRTFSGSADRQVPAAPLGPIVEAFLGGVEPVLRPEDLAWPPDSADPRFLIVQRLRDRLAHASARTPVLVTVDDVQWADGASQVALRTLPARTASLAVLWILALRGGGDAGPGETTAARLIEAGAQVLDLRPLEPAAVRDLVEHLLGRDPPGSVLPLVSRADGDPSLLVELLRGLAEEHAGEYRRSLPLRFHRLVDRRVACLQDTSRWLVTVASVLGREFRVRELEALLDRSASALVQPLEEALAEDVVVPRDEYFAFRSDLVRQAILEELPADLVRRLRRQAVGAELRAGRPPEEVAPMLADAAQPGDDEAVDLLRRAASSTDAGNPGRAAEFARRALALASPTGPGRGALIAQTAHLLMQAGRTGEAGALVETSLQEPLEPAAEGAVRAIAALVAVLAADRSAAVSAVRQCRIAVALPDLPPAVRAEVLAVLALALLDEGGDAADTVRSAVAAGRAAGNRRAEALALAVGAIHDLPRSGWRRCLAELEQASLLSTRIPAAERLCTPQMWTAMVLSAAGRTTDALAVADVGCRQPGAQPSTALGRRWRALRAQLLFDAGRLADARAEALTCLDSAGDGADLGEFSARATLGRVALLSGDDAALLAAEADLPRMLRSASATVRAVGAWLGALIADHRGDAERAVQLASRLGGGGEERAAWPGSPADPSGAAALVRMALRAGRRDQAAAAVAAAAHRVAASPGVVVVLAAHGHARGLLEGNAAEVRRAAALLEGEQRPLACASALEDAGRLAAARPPVDEEGTDRGRSEVVRLLERAMRIYDDVGAGRDAARVRARLRELGVHRRRAVRPAGGQGWDALTPTERDVVELIAEGATNRTAAERLYISPHTVSHHLRHAFDKLGIRSRNELTRIVLSHSSSPPG